MSTINPDERGRRIGEAVRPYAFGLLYFSIASAPLVALIKWTIGIDDTAMVAVFMGYVLLCVIAGTAALYVPSGRYEPLIAAYILVYIGGLFLVMRSAAAADDDTPFWVAVLLIGVPYAVAIGLLVVHIQRRGAVAITASRGIDTTATVVSAGVDGMINYVQHQRLSLKFTDNKGVERYLRIVRTGGGYSAGDKVSLRYDPEQPWSKRSIVVGG
ncbi:hypothetical protein BH09ACT4_BH09ACT4_08050 [soil metagenome]